MASGLANSDMDGWELLQQKIFTRWINQKLGSQRLPQISDVLKDIGQGTNLLNLIQVLSEKVCTSSLVLPALPPQAFRHHSVTLTLSQDFGYKPKKQVGPVVIAQQLEV